MPGSKDVEDPEQVSLGKATSKSIYSVVATPGHRRMLLLVIVVATFLPSITNTIYVPALEVCATCCKRFGLRVVVGKGESWPASRGAEFVQAQASVRLVRDAHLTECCYYYHLLCRPLHRACMPVLQQSLPQLQPMLLQRGCQ